MSFRWKGLLGVGSNSNSTSGPTSPNSHLQDGKENWLVPDEQEWVNHSFDPLDVPNMLGLENFGNTCYVNSVMQALYFCDPFRESILAYSAKQLPNKAALSQNLSKSGPDYNSSQNEVDTLFLALKSLFQRMASAQVTIPTGQTNQQSQSESPSHSTSFIGSGLSRKVSSRPGTASGGKVGVNAAIHNASSTANVITHTNTTNSANPAVGIPSPNPLQTNANSCSNIVVSDTDIKAFLTSLRKNNILFDSTAHQDAHELFNFVLNRIGEDIVDEAKIDGRMNGKLEESQNIVHDVEPNGKTMVHRLFEGILTNETRCLTCESVTSRDECFLDLSLDIERNTSVTACLRQFSASEMLCARNKFFCDTCSGLQEAEKRMKIKKLPNVLALHLKRFKYEESVQRFVKLAYRVVFPMQLRLFNTSDDAEDPDKLYELYGIIVHIGVGPHHGHYVAIIKVDKRWFVFDDETISVIDESDISRYFGDTPGAGSAYVLFYQAVDLDMPSLGLPDVKAMRAEKAKVRREENIKKRVELHKQQTVSPLSDTLSTPMQRGSSGTASASSLFSGFLGSSSNQTAIDGTNDGAPLEVPSRSTTPAEGRSGLFGRFQSPSSSASNTNPPLSINGATLQIPSIANQAPASPTSAEPNESKGSWLTSLRSRKGSANVATNQIFPQSSPTLSSNKVLHAEPLVVEDDGQHSLSATSSNHADERNSREERRTLSPQKAVERQRSPLRTDFAAEEKRDELYKSKGERRATLTGGPLTSSTSTNASPNKSIVRLAAPGQGAAFTPAERPLSKKEQEKIARKARRNTSISVSTAHTPAFPPSPPPPSNPLPAPIVMNANALGHSPNERRKSDEDPTPLPTSNSAMSGWRRVTTPRRPTTADPSSIDPSKATAQRRRSTLSRTFGFGKKEKNSDAAL
ncbi:hypothetical protein L7F22_042004 [Adiantum nelumboides]|nr:hypothetical protein [Adiantum nelumboides]